MKNKTGVVYRNNCNTSCYGVFNEVFHLFLLSVLPKKKSSYIFL